MSVMKIIFSDSDNVKNQPEVDIEKWSIHEIKLKNEAQQLVLIGFVTMTKKYRVTTAIQHFDSNNKKITTNSGRVYNLLGQPGSKDAELELVWELWKKTNNISADFDITNQYFFLH